jgi:hypothetical protein
MCGVIPHHRHGLTDMLGVRIRCAMFASAQPSVLLILERIRLCAALANLGGLLFFHQQENKSQCQGKAPPGDDNHLDPC